MISEIKYKDAIDFLLPRHYSGRKPNISIAFGYFHNNSITAVCTFGKPASPYLCKGVCGDDNASYVIELNRLCVDGGMEIPLSKFVSYCLKNIGDKIVVSYSDTDMGHNGYIYQACNFLYTGCTKARTDIYAGDGRHPRHHSGDTSKRIARSAKHRYIYFATKRKSLKKLWIKSLRYGVEDYPKGDNKRYNLGCFLKKKILESDL